MTCAETPPAEQPPASMTIPAEYLPNEEALVTEHDAMLNNLFCAKQQRLLVESLYSSWAGPGEGRSFLVNSVYHSILSRVADGPGLSHWTNALLNGGSDETIIASILSSDEYFLSH